MKDTVPTKTYDTDSLMRRLYESLVRDFRSVMGSEYKEDNIIALRGGMKIFRNMKSPDRLQAPPYVFKMEAQLENLFKRYRFRQDVYTDAELSELTFKKFRENQERLAKHQQMPLRFSTDLVLRQARKIVREILDKVDLTEFTQNCRFSTRATAGNTARDAYIDHKLSDPISGSPEHIRWFNNHLSENYALFRAIVKCQPTGQPDYMLCNSLKLVEVPKSFKTFRLIMPNTLIGSYYTYGLGLVLAEALKKEGLNIAKLQYQHRKYAKLASIHRAWVTADMSNASESFLFWLISRLLPQKWVRALNCGRSRYYEVDGKQYSYASFMAMGIGFTFPLQTLLFYAISKSCCILLGMNDPFISVYGDDLIYPRKAHRYIAMVLKYCGMLLNNDKTFVESHFRESCGGDYYHGVDVRPFQPEGVHRYLRPKAYEAWLYQIVNGLFARWDIDQIPITGRLLRLEILRVTMLIKQVPMSYPDYSGWRVRVPETSPFSGMAPILVRFSHGSREYVVPHLRQTARHRYVSFEDAYLYDWLRSKSLGDSKEEPSSFHVMTLAEWLKVETRWRQREITQTWMTNTRESLSFRPFPKQPKNYRSSTGKRLKRCIATTPCKLEAQKITSETDTISDWI